MRKAVCFIVALYLALASGSALAARVTVVNTTDDPVPVQDVNNAMHPVQAKKDFTIIAGNQLKDVALFEVPSGKRLVIEYFSCWSQLVPGSSALFSILTEVGSVTVRHYLPLTLPAPSVPLVQSAVAAGQQVRLYANPETKVSVRADILNDAPFDISNSCQISGYLVDVP
jgi:hypothetical protein